MAVTFGKRGLTGKIERFFTVTDGLVLHLDAGVSQSYPGTGTTWFDLSNNGNNGTLVGPTYNSSNGGSMVFDGNNDKVTFPNNTIDTSAGITAESWFNTPTGTKYSDIFDLADIYGVWMVINYNSQTGKIMGGFKTNVSYMIADYTADSWYHFVITGSGTTNTMYLNGVQVDTKTDSVATSINLNTARIGNVDGDRAAEYFIGNIPIFRLYNKELSASEVNQNFEASRQRFGI